MFTESDLLPISALQHLVFCERQCALIHIERLWEENRFTAEGKILHEKTDKEETESRGDCRIARSLLLQCKKLGLYGRADVVEFHKVNNDKRIILPGVNGLWVPYPVEYKRGKPKSDRCDEVQLCAQALSLEEMLNTDISEGALYYGTPRRRTIVNIDTNLRDETAKIAERLHALINKKITPHAVYDKKCENCSLNDLCMPLVNRKNGQVDDYINSIFDSAEGCDDEAIS